VVAFQPIVELGLAATSAGVFVLDSSLLDGADVLAGGDGFVWTDVTDDVVGPVRCQRGSQQGSVPTLRYDGGSISFELDNQDGRYDPANTSGPFYPQLKPGVAVRLRVESDNWIYGPWTVFTGVVSSWQPRYPAGDLISTVEIAGEDNVALFARADLPALDTAVGAGESATDRLDRIADRIGWPAAKRHYETSSGSIATMQATTMAQPAWTEMLLTADSDCGFVWFDQVGTLRYTGPAQIPAGVFIEFDMDSPSSMAYYDEFEPRFDLEEVFNAANIARVGGHTVSAVDETGVAESGLRAYTRTDLICETDDQCDRVAQWVVFWRGRARYRIGSITCRGTRDLLFLLNLDMGKRLKVVQHTPDGRDVTVEGLSRGLEWTIHPAVGEWELRIAMQSVRPAILDAFILDSSLLDSAEILVP